jgi:hypothetical protein
MSQAFGSGSPGGGILGGGSIAGGVSGIAGAVSDLFASQGDQAEAANYEEAAGLATQEAQFTKLATGIAETQQARQIEQAVGGVQAGYAGGGLALSGSAGDVLRESAEQGALAQQMTQYQGMEQVASYQEQAASYNNMAEAAKKASQGGIFGAVLQGAAGIANLATAGGGSSIAAGLAALV